MIEELEDDEEIEDEEEDDQELNEFLEQEGAALFE